MPLLSKRRAMKVGVIADTHDNLPYIRRALEVFQERGCRTLIHAGDYVAPFALKALMEFPGKVYGVLGNCDGELDGLRKLMPDLSDGPLVLQLDSCRIVVVHDVQKLSDADVLGADVIVCGHTHEARIGRTESKPLMINPGECAGWLSGNCTVAVLDTAAVSAELINLKDGESA